MLIKSLQFSRPEFCTHLVWVTLRAVPLPWKGFQKLSPHILQWQPMVAEYILLCITSLDPPNTPKEKVLLCSYFTYKQIKTRNGEIFAQDGRASMRKVAFIVPSPISEPLWNTGPPNIQGTVLNVPDKVQHTQDTETFRSCAKPQSHSGLASWPCDLCSCTELPAQNVPVLGLMFCCHRPEILNNFTFEFVICKRSPIEQEHACKQKRSAKYACSLLLSWCLSAQVFIKRAWCYQVALHCGCQVKN